jgi:hypothetical protein
MKAFVRYPLSEQALYFRQASEKLNLSVEAIEKDFWAASFL